MDRETLEIVFTKIRGRVGDEVGYVVNGKQRWRKYKKPELPVTGNHIPYNKAMSRLVKRWHGLTEKGRARWNTLAENKGRKGVTGFNLYIGNGLKRFAEQQRRRQMKRMFRGAGSGHAARRFVRSIRPRAERTAVSLNLPALSRAPT